MKCPNCGNADKELIERYALRNFLATEKCLNSKPGPGTEYYCLSCGTYFTWRRGTGFMCESGDDDVRMTARNQILEVTGFVEEE